MCELQFNDLEIVDTVDPDNGYQYICTALLYCCGNDICF